MKLLFIFIIILIFWKGWNFKERFSNVIFCNKAEACNILKNNHKWYFKGMNEKEKKVRGIIGDSEMHYCSKFLEFSEDEKRCLEHCVTKCDEMALNKGIDFGGKWRFILCDGLEDNMPHTIGGYIVVNKRFLKLGDEKICRTLLHEIVHVWQKENYDLFKQVYYAWGWKPAFYKRVKKYFENGRMNPDSWDYWSWKGIMPYVLLEDNRGLDDIRVVGINVENGEEFDLEEWKEYVEKFDVAQNYHPNEISAILLRDYIVDNRRGWAIDLMIKQIIS